MVRHSWLIGCLLALQSGCGEFNRPLGGPAGLQKRGAPTSPAPTKKMVADDERIEAILAGNDNVDKPVPAEEFFAKLGPEYKLWKGQAEWFQKLAEDAAAAGSPGVYSVVAEAFGTKVAAEFVIVMPSDAASRAKVIEAYNQFWKKDWDELDAEEKEELQHELAEDRGQKYLSLIYDP